MEKFIGIRPSKTVAVERFVVIFYRNTLRAACAVCWQHAKPQRRMITSMIVIETTIIYIYIWIYIYIYYPNFNLSLSPDYRRLSPGCMFRDACGHRALQQTRVECVRTSRWCQTCPLQKWYAEKTTKKHCFIEKAETKDEHENDKSKDKAHNKCIVVIKIVIVSHIVILPMTTDIHLPKKSNGWNLKTPPIEKEKHQPKPPILGVQNLGFWGCKEEWATSLIPPFTWYWLDLQEFWLGNQEQIQNANQLCH